MGTFGHDFEFAKKVGDYRPESWQRALSQGAPAWGEAYSGTLIFDTDEVQYLLSLYRVRETMAFLYSATGRNGVHLRYLASVGDSNALERFITMQDLAEMPEGCFLPWDDGVKAICDFLANPTAPSARVEWIDVDAIAWPEP